MHKKWQNYFIDRLLTPKYIIHNPEIKIECQIQHTSLKVLASQREKITQRTPICDYSRPVATKSNSKSELTLTELTSFAHSNRVYIQFDRKQNTTPNSKQIHEATKKLKVTTSSI